MHSSEKRVHDKPKVTTRQWSFELLRTASMTVIVLCPFSTTTNFPSINNRRDSNESSSKHFRKSRSRRYPFSLQFQFGSYANQTNESIFMTRQSTLGFSNASCFSGKSHSALSAWLPKSHQKYTRTFEHDSPHFGERLGICHVLYHCFCSCRSQSTVSLP